MINLRTFRPSIDVIRIVLASILLVVMPSVSATYLSASLTESELRFSDVAANNQAWLQTRNANNAQTHPLGIQTLSIEMDERKKNKTERRSRVYQFNYRLQQSRLVLVDLTNQTIVDTKAIASVHLPLNDVEIEMTRALTEQQAFIMQLVNQELQARGLAGIANLASLDVKASIFEPNEKSHVCATQRCALVSLFDDTRTVFNVEPIVNLQTQTVSTLKQDL